MNGTTARQEAEKILAELPERISDVIKPFVRQTPDHPALVQGDVTWTYAELAAVVADTARILQLYDIRAGDRVIIVSENCLALAALILAASEIDAWPVVVNPRLSAREVDLIREHSGARRVFYTIEVSDAAGQHAERHDADIAVLRGLGTLGVGPLNRDTVPEPVEVDWSRVVRAETPRSDDAVGSLITGIEARLVKPGGGTVAPGEVGELHVRGPNVMRGYYRAPEATAAVIDADGWFNTGDLARFDGDILYIVGRTKELIIRSGFNVYPPEVEAVLNEHAAVVQSAVIGRPVPGNEEVVAFVQVLPGSTTTPADLMAHAARQLTPYKRPSEIIVLEALPAGSTGKILKHRLAETARQQATGLT